MYFTDRTNKIYYVVVDLIVLENIKQNYNDSIIHSYNVQIEWLIEQHIFAAILLYSNLNK